jgi:CheY-like chemotaxis protein
MQAGTEVRRALLVEDEVLVAMYVEDALSELGYAIAGVATNLGEALAYARERQFDFAVLDINLNGQKSFPVADLLRQRQIPFLFVSGYTSGGIADEYRNEMRLRKPFRTSDLAKAIVHLLSRF